MKKYRDKIAEICHEIEEGVIVRQIFVEHDDPDSATLHLRTTTLSLFPLRSLRLCVLCVKICPRIAPKAQASGLEPRR